MGNCYVLSDEIKLGLTRQAREQIDEDCVTFSKKIGTYVEEIIIKTLEGIKRLRFDTNNRQDFYTRVFACQEVYRQLTEISQVMLQSYNKDSLEKNGTEREEIRKKIKDSFAEQSGDAFLENSKPEQSSDIKSFVSGAVDDILRSFVCSEHKINKILCKETVCYRVSAGRMKELVANVLHKMKFNFKNASIYNAQIEEKIKEKQISHDKKHYDEVYENLYIEYLLSDCMKGLLDDYLKGKDGGDKSEDEIDDETGKICEDLKIDFSANKSFNIPSEYVEVFHSFPKKVVEILDMETCIDEDNLKKIESEFTCTFNGCEEEFLNNWIASELFDENYFKWVDKVFDLGSEREVYIYPSEKLRARTKVIPGNMLRIFKNDMNKLLRAILEYYARLPLYQRERIAFSTQHYAIEDFQRERRKDKNTRQLKDKPAMCLALYDYKEEHSFVCPKVEVEINEECNYVIGFDVKHQKVDTIRLCNINCESGSILSQNLNNNQMDKLQTNKKIKDMIKKSLNCYSLSEVGRCEEVKEYKVSNLTKDMIEQIISFPFKRPRGIRSLDAKPDGKGRYSVTVKGIEQDIKTYFGMICCMTQPEMDFDKLKSDFDNIKFLEVRK